jgi:hypothetical protein
MVPDRGFALTLLTNSESGPNLVEELFTDDWALRRFGVSNLPAVPRALSPAQLAPYEDIYTQQSIGPAGDLETGQFQLTAANFVRGTGGRVDWLLQGGRLSRHETTAAASPDRSTTPSGRTHTNPFQRRPLAIG